MAGQEHPDWLATVADVERILKAVEAVRQEVLALRSSPTMPDHEIPIPRFPDPEPTLPPELELKAFVDLPSPTVDVAFGPLQSKTEPWKERP